MKRPKFKIGEFIKTKGAIDATGEILNIVEGGYNLGFPWHDDTPHYEIKDARTGVIVFAHERSIRKIR